MVDVYGLIRIGYVIAFGCVLPTTGQLRDFHPLECALAERTMENLTGGIPPVRYLPCVVPCKLYFCVC